MATLKDLLNEALNPKQKFFGTTIGWTRQQVMAEINDALVDEGKDKLPIEKFTDEVCQEYADLMLAAYDESAGEKMVHAHMEVTDKMMDMLTK